MSMHAKFPPFTAPTVREAKPAQEVSPVEAKLRTARQYIYHANLLIDEALGLLNPPIPGSLDELPIERAGEISAAEVMLQRMEASDDDTVAE